MVQRACVCGCAYVQFLARVCLRLCGCAAVFVFVFALVFVPVLVQAHVSVKALDKMTVCEAGDVKVKVNCG